MDSFDLSGASYEQFEFPAEPFYMDQGYVEGILQPYPTHQVSIGVMPAGEFDPGFHSAAQLAHSPVPEPATMLVMLAGIGGIALRKMAKRRV